MCVQLKFVLNKVSLMTIHAAKGLEFPYVFVVGMEENIFPSAMSIPSRADLEEERRLFYVAVTRAMKYLSLSYATFRYLYGKSSCQEPSRFVSEIDNQFVDRTSAESPFPQVGQMPKAFFQFGKPSEQQSNSHTSTAFKPRPKTTSTVFRSKAPTPPASPVDIAKIQAGMRVRHAKFGFGKVLSVEEVNGDRRAIVFFDNLGQKTLILKFAKLEIVE
ncbi:MAG: ATP-binding domain-containing protein [Bacteroidales bacterium]|nr:ATP-binding domain-containing protein [Candidatus Colimorpha onthohippi]